MLGTVLILIDLCRLVLGHLMMQFLYSYRSREPLSLSPHGDRIFVRMDHDGIQKGFPDNE